MATAKQATKAKVVAPGSPQKAKKPPSMRENLKLRKEKPVPTISVQGFQVVPLAAEAYEYTITNLKNGFLNEFRKYVKGEITSDELTNANFVGLKTKRYRGKGNEPLMDSDGYSRVWILRYPLEGKSTALTRQEGLRVLKDFFMSKKATNYPPNDIAVIDRTTDDVPVWKTTFWIMILKKSSNSLVMQMKLTRSSTRLTLNLQVKSIPNRSPLRLLRTNSDFRLFWQNRMTILSKLLFVTAHYITYENLNN